MTSSGRPAVELAPEIGDEIAAVQAEIDRSILEGKLHDDPLRHPLLALRNFIGVLHRLLADGRLTLAETIREARQPIDKAAVDAMTQALTQAVVRDIGSHHATLARIEARKHRRWQGGVYATVAGGGLLVGAIGAETLHSSRLADAMQENAEMLASRSTLEMQMAKDGQPNVGQWVALATYNHIADIERSCRITVVGGRRRCDTSLWLDPPPAAPEAAR